MSNEVVLYHGTSKVFLPDILERGLRPAYRAEKIVPEAITKVTDFTLTTHYETAEYYARLSPYGRGPNPIVLEYHVPLSELSKYLYGGRPQTWDYVAVPPGHLQFALKRPLSSKFLVATHEYESGSMQFYGSGEFRRIPRRREIFVHKHRRRA